MGTFLFIVIYLKSGRMLDKSKEKYTGLGIINEKIKKNTYIIDKSRESYK